MSAAFFPVAEKLQRAVRLLEEVEQLVAPGQPAHKADVERYAGDLARWAQVLWSAASELAGPEYAAQRKADVTEQRIGEIFHLVAQLDRARVQAICLEASHPYWREACRLGEIQDALAGRALKEGAAS